MKRWLIVLLLSWPACCVPALSQTTADRGIRTSICEIATKPEQYRGKLVTVRAQIWSAYDRLWLNDSVAGSLEFNRFCGWLPAEFAHPTDLGGSRAFGTFTGRVVIDQSSSSRPVRFVVER